MLFQDNRDFCRDFLKKIWISHTFCPFWSQFWSTKWKQIGLGTKISIKIFVKIHYFSVEIEKKIKKSTKITNNHKNLDKSPSRPKSTVLADLIETKSRNLDRDFSIVETNFWKPSRLSITSRLILFWRRDRESRSRPCRDKLRPPSLNINLKNWRNFVVAIASKIY
jgi:hypothetical protein